MTVYNKGREYKEARESTKERTEERSPSHRLERKEQPIVNDPEFHEEIMENIKQLTGQQGLYENFRRKLRRAEENGDITKDNFIYYKSLADKQMQKQEKSAQKKAEKEAQKQEQIAVTGSLNYDSNYEERLKREEEAKAKLDDRKVRGENIEEDAKKENGSKLSKFKQFFTFMKSPIARVGIFIILGVFLIFYLTRINMGDVIDSPIIIILAVLFIILILGRGGKTRSVDSNSFF